MIDIDTDMYTYVFAIAFKIVCLLHLPWLPLNVFACLARTYLQSKTGESIMIQDSPDAIKNMNPGGRLHFNQHVHFSWGCKDARAGAGFKGHPV